ncbi:MAG TPA: hypothetical protein VEL76_26405 [Gemmataceae bacterium]|nr:hypothetical protein [Gemmataceae bacterium]
MVRSQEVDYTVVLIFPGFGTDRENAETVVTTALDWLNTNKDEPGFRFAPPVSAHLEIVSDADEARDRIDADESIAMLFLHDLDDNERDALIRQCETRHIAACYTVDIPRPGSRRKGPWPVVVRKKTSDDLPAHRLCTETLTAPVGEDEETGERIGEVIAVLALGVMQHHWLTRPPR